MKKVTLSIIMILLATSVSGCSGDIGGLDATITVTEASSIDDGDGLYFDDSNNNGIHEPNFGESWDRGDTYALPNENFYEDVWPIPNGLYDSGEPIFDYGQDGLPNTGDPGEGDGKIYPLDKNEMDGVWDSGDGIYGGEGDYKDNFQRVSDVNGDGLSDFPDFEVDNRKIEMRIDYDFDEDLDALISEEATLSDGFKDKAGTIFEAVLTSKLTQEVDRLESEYASNLEEEVSDIQDGLVEKVNSYLDYVVENWMKENELAVQNGLRTEIAEEFMTSLQTVFKEHYIEVPEGKVDLVDELNEQVNELEVTLNKTTDDNIDLHSRVSQFERDEVVRNASSGLADTEAEKLAGLVEDIDFDNKETFEKKVKTVVESYFKQEGQETADEVDSLLGEENADEESVVSEAMSQYTQAITKYEK